MSNHLSDHHKAYYTYIDMYMQVYNAMCHIDSWEIFNHQNLSFLLSKGLYLFQECVCAFVLEL